jgi:hypothetical protein
MDENCYGCINTELNNDFIADIDNYLTRIEIMMHIVVNWKGTRIFPDDNKDGLFKSSFEQPETTKKKKSFRCFKSGKK